MSGDDHFIKPDNNVAPSDMAHALRKLYRNQPLIDQAADTIVRLQTNVRHWREECGKLHAQLAKARADLHSWEVTAKRIEEAERPNDVECQTCEGSGEIFHGGGGPDDPERCHVCTGTGIVQRYPEDGTCIRCGAVPRNASGLCATCVDEDAVRDGEMPDMAGVAEQSGAGAPETSVRCGAPAAIDPFLSQDGGQG